MAGAAKYELPPDHVDYQSILPKSVEQMGNGLLMN
jgi:hypothetical protein